MDVFKYKDRLYIDTPGLIDPEMRQRAAVAITDALKQGIPYKVMFVITLQENNVRSQDLATMALVLEATKDQIRPDEYGVIINKVPYDLLETAKSETDIILQKYINEKNNITRRIICLEENLESVDKDKAILLLSKDFLKFVKGVPSINIDPKMVKDID